MKPNLVHTPKGLIPFDTGIITVTLNKYITIIDTDLGAWRLEGGVDRDKKPYPKGFKP